MPLSVLHVLHGRTHDETRQLAAGWHTVTLGWQK